MLRVREILRLHHEHGLGCKRIARSCNVGKNTVLRCLQRARAAGLGWGRTHLAVWTFTKISIRQERARNLSIREQEVSGYIANGYTCKEVAKDLGISHRTVEAHRAKIMKKLGCRNTAELVSKIIQLDALK